MSKTPQYTPRVQLFDDQEMSILMDGTTLSIAGEKHCPHSSDSAIVWQKIIRLFPDNACPSKADVTLAYIEDCEYYVPVVMIPLGSPEGDPVRPYDPENDPELILALAQHFNDHQVIFR